MQGRVPSCPPGQGAKAQGTLTSWHPAPLKPSLREGLRSLGLWHPAWRSVPLFGGRRPIRGVRPPGRQRRGDLAVCPGGLPERPPAGEAHDCHGGGHATYSAKRRARRERKGGSHGAEPSQRLEQGRAEPNGAASTNLSRRPTRSLTTTSSKASCAVSVAFDRRPGGSATSRARAPRWDPRDDEMQGAR